MKIVEIIQSSWLEYDQRDTRQYMRIKMHDYVYA